MLTFGLALFAAAPLARAETAKSESHAPTRPDDKPQAVDADLDNEAHAGPVTPIEAKSYDARIERKSRSKRVYLFDLSAAPELPRTGRILLLKREGVSVMAFRVLKPYPDKKQVAAKRVKRYQGIQELSDGTTYLAVEKISDLETPALSARDSRDMKELEGSGGGGAGGVQEFDPELDAATSPPPTGAADSAKEQAPAPSIYDESDEQDELLGISLEDVFPIDPYHHWISAQIGYIRNLDPSGNSAYFIAGGLRYAINVADMIFLKRSRLQDSLSVEGGLFNYKAIGLAKSDDAYTLLPIIATLRYNVLFGEEFGLYLYGGIQKNHVLSSNNPDPDTLGALGSTLPSAGAGMLFRIGPSWYARVDLGLDILSAGLVLRF